MALVVLGEEQPLLPVELRREHRELSGEQALLKELLFEPERQRHPERPKAARSELQVGLEQALELQKGLVVEGDVVDVAQADSRFGEAILDGAPWIAAVVLLAAEPLLLGRRHDTAVLDESGRAVVVERRDAEDPHRHQNSV